MKIVYLHGLESNINQKDPKIMFLNNNFDEVYTPSINYKDKNVFSKLLSKIKSINPDLIVGSSMGGYFAYLIGSKLGIETVLFNPGVVDRGYEPVVDDSNLKGTKHNVYLGKNDNVINGENVMRYFGHAGSGSFYYTKYSGGHRVPADIFINAIKDTTGIKEQESTQIYKKRKFIMKHIRKINDEFVNLTQSVDESSNKTSEVNEAFAEWEMSFAPMILSGVTLDPKNVYKVKARSTVEAIKKASKMAGLSGNDWMATVTNKLEKLK